MRRALVVGINNYSFSPLLCCENDARDVAAILERNGDDSRNFDVVLETDITHKHELKGKITELFSVKCDVALLYFSGHGCVESTGGYIVTPDYHVNDAGVSMDEILKIANDSKATNKVIILDCCYSGALGSPALTKGEYAVISEGMTVLTASTDSESAVEFAGHGMFTNLLLHALKGEAADITGNITPGSIYAYIDKALGGWDQRPVFKTNITQFLSLRNVQPVIDLSILRKIPSYFYKPQDELRLNPSFEFTNSKEIEHEIKEPFADEDNVAIFKDLQKLERIGLVEPVGEDHMYYAAMNSTSCKLTPLGWHYWKLTSEKRI